MRKALRVTALVVFSFLMQGTVLPYLKIAGVMLDLMMISLFAVGYSSGLYVGLMGGFLGALLMEVGGGDLPGLTTFYCVGAGAFGGWVVARVRAISMPGKRALEQRIKQFAPAALTLGLVLAKEAIYVGYFYLTGSDVTGMHILRVIMSGIVAGVFSLVLYPLFQNFINRRPEDSFLARRIRRFERRKAERAGKREAREKKRQAKEAPPEAEPLTAPIKGGMDG